MRLQIKNIALTCVFALATTTAVVAADTYAIDVKGMHASVQFRIQHLGFSWLTGRFDRFDGSFTFDEKTRTGSVTVTIDTASINSGHSERDKHLRSKDFLHVDMFDTARFHSTDFQLGPNGVGVLRGDLTLRGVTKPIAIDVQHIGGGKDPWGSYRQGFIGTTELTLADFGMDFNLGPASRVVELTLNIEGIRQ